MPRIAPVVMEEVDATTAATLKAVKAQLGVLPNLFTTVAQAPAALNGYLQLNEALAHGRLTARQREMIAIAVAQENACEYCLSAHAAIGKGTGLGPEDIRRARVGEAANALDNAVTAFALAVARSRASVDDSELEAARAAGLDDGLVIEIIANVAVNVLTNYVNRIADTDVDFPVVDLNTTA